MPTPIIVTIDVSQHVVSVFGRIKRLNHCKIDHSHVITKNGSRCQQTHAFL